MVSSVITPWPSGTCATPARAISSGGRRARLTPATRTRPWRGRTNPVIVRSSVLLPAPLAPSTAVIVPGIAEIETPWSPGPPPYPATISSTASAAVSVRAGLFTAGLLGPRGGLRCLALPTLALPTLALPTLALPTLALPTLGALLGAEVCGGHS